MQPVIEMKCIPDIITNKAKQTPEAVALVCDGRRITYSELNRKSNQLASHLRLLGVRQGVRVAVSPDTAVEAVVGLLGVLKSGGVYIPINPGYPAEWRDFILADSNASVLLTRSDLRDLPATGSSAPIRIESDWESFAQASEDDPLPLWGPADLACVFYSTPREATRIDHQALSVRLQLLQEKLQFTGEDVVYGTQYATFPDAELYRLLPLAFGGRLVMKTAIDEDQKDLLRVVESDGITVARLTPSELSRFLNSLDEQSAADLSSLRRVVCSGEPLHRTLVDRFFSVLPGCELHYCYAPPEAGRETTWHVCRAGEARDYMPIGRPVRSVSVQVLDKRGRLSPIGLAGELFVAGQGLARKVEGGGAASPSMAALSGLRQDQAETLRGTSDMARWLSDGSLELLKMNRRVWFRGRRVELKEIEQALITHPAVSDCAVLARETEGHAYELVAYTVLSEPYAEDRLRVDLERYLPFWLVPRFFVPVVQLPLTASGKVDEEALASLEVIDDSVTERWAQQLRSIPEIEQVAVVARDHFEIPAPLVLSELLPEEERRPSRPVAAPATEVIDKVEVACPAISEGEPITAELPATLGHLLETAARLSGQQGIIYLQADDNERFQSYSSLLDEAECIASGLRSLGLKPGDKVIFQLQDNRDFLTGFWGCILSGCIPVPISIAPTYKEMNSILHKLRNAWEMLGHPIILTSSSLQSSVAGLKEMFNLDRLRVEAVDELRRHANDGLHHKAEADDPAVILLTSGSTGMPKGVVLQHRNVISRCYATTAMNQFSAEDISLNWLPMDHVGGIVMFHLRDVFLRCRQVHATTNAFLERPLSWLDWIDRYGATVTWAPNFAYALVNAQSEKVREGHWDLSSMRFILNAGEAIVPETASRFLEILAPHGLPETAMHPAWGMSETSSAVTYSDKFRDEGGAGSSPFVEVGKPVPGISIRIVNNQGELLNEKQIGRLQIRGNTVTRGYYENPKLNQESFSEDGWFITGDLGLIRDGALTITGREKDVIIINGINYYSHEIEGVVDTLSGLASSFTAACAVRDPGSQTDKLAIFFNPVDDDAATVAKLLNDIREKVVGDIGINPSYLIPVAKEMIPKTEIGKIQRAKLRERFEAGEFDAIMHQVEIQTGKADTIPDWFYQRTWLAREPVLFADHLAGKHYLLFMDGSARGEALTVSLKANGASFTLIRKAGSFEETGPGEYRIDPGNREHYHRVFASLADEGVTISGIVYLWSCEKFVGDITSIDALRQAQRDGIYSLLFTTQALAKVADTKQRTDLYVITHKAQPVEPDEPIAWEHGAIRGLVRTVRQEVPWIRCLQVDIEDDSADAILSEMKTNQNEVEVAFRRGKRLVQRLSKVDLLKSAKKDIPMQREGLYLITGGLGGIGTELARFLIERYDARLVLIGRTPLDNPADEPKTAARQANYDALKRLTDQLVYKAVDVCDLNALQAVVAEAEKQWQRPLAGVFHLAGEGNLVEHWSAFDQHRVEGETVENFGSMFQSKVYGTWALSQLLNTWPEAIFVTFSSVNGVFGGANFSAYSAANSFLEDFSIHDRRARGHRTYCFSWTIWDDIGMSEGNPDYAMDMVRSQGYQVISKKQGFNSLLAGLSRGSEHLIVGLDGGNRNIRKYALQRTVKTKKLAAHFTATAENLPPASFKNLSVRDQFGVATSCEFVQLAEMPMTAEGLVDVQALTARSQTFPDGRHEATAPRTETEKTLAMIWQDILQIDKVGLEDNFFILGGHSLLAMQVISRIREAFKVELPLRALFESPTIAEMADRIEAEAQPAESFEMEPIRRADRNGHLPLSYPQQRLWFLIALNPTSTFYNIPAAVKLSGKLHVDALSSAIDEVVRRHEVLRTVFVREQGRPVQVIKEFQPLKLEVEDLQYLPADEKQAALNHRLIQEDREPFDLAKGPLLRMRLVRLEPDEHVLLFTLHHIVSDGWSTGVMIQEVGALYAAYSQGLPSPLPDLEIQYADYAVWQRGWLQGEVLDQQLAYWRNQLAGASALSLPTDKPRPPMQSFRGDRRFIRFDEELTSQLRELSRSQGVTLYMVLLAGFQLLLHRYSGQTDIAVGSPIAGRNRAELEPLIGFFVNTLVMRTDLSDDPTVRELLGRVREVSLGAYGHQEVPFEQLVDELQPERDLSRNPLFQVMFALQNTTQHPSQFLRNLTISPLPVENTTAKFDLTLLMEEGEKYLSGALEYCTDLFNEDTIARMLEQMERLLHAMADNPDQRISELSLLSESQRNEILISWNDTAALYPKEKSISQLFEEQVERTPEAVAISFGKEQLTYRELNQRANRLAHYLRSLGVGPERRVGIYMERSIEMLVDILGTFKAGGAYVPLDPTYPKERVSFMFEDAGVSVLLTSERILRQFPELGAKALCTDADREKIARESEQNPDNLTASENIAYVIYTSGSTGRPKGVMISQSGLVNYLYWCAKSYRVAEGAGSLVHSPLGFDLTITSLFSPLLVGKSVVLLPEEEGIEGLVRALVAGNSYSLVKVTPSHLEMLNRYLTPEQAARCCNALIIGGEALQADSLTFWRESAPGTRLINEYGPTETVVGCCVYEAGPQDLMRGPVPIGRPIANTQLYILDKALQVVPVGVAGELYIAGAGLARGYLNRPDITAEMFIPNPLAGEAGARMYRTGDVARYLPGGDIEFLGRKDNQVKIRGYRIELGEIESELENHESIREAVVLARGEQDKSLVAYMVSSNGNKLSVTELRDYLKRRLPDYMVPARYVWLERMPVTANGKLDMAGLTEAEEETVASEHEYSAPTGPVEELLAGIWATLLSVPQVGIHDNFFELGGDSLKLTQAQDIIQQQLNCDLSLAEMFQFPTIHLLAQRISGGEQGATVQDVAEPLESLKEGKQNLLQQRRQRKEKSSNN